MSKRKLRTKAPTRPKRALTPGQQARLQQAAQAHRQGNLAYAEAEYRVLVAERVRIPELYTNLGRICAGKRRVGEAREWWTKALAMDPGFVGAGMGLAESYQQTGRAETTKRIYRQSLSANPHNTVVHCTLANLQ
jgi:Flp pilus assembly protein TadD